MFYNRYKYLGGYNAQMHLSKEVTMEVGKDYKLIDISEDIHPDTFAPRYHFVFNEIGIENPERFVLRITSSREQIQDLSFVMSKEDISTMMLNQIISIYFKQYDRKDKIKKYLDDE